MNVLKKMFSNQTKSSKPDLFAAVQPRTLSGETSCIQFTVHQASGGHVVECSTYDRTKDRYIHGLHIITADQDIGKRLEHILSFEMLRR